MTGVQFGAGIGGPSAAASAVRTAQSANARKEPGSEALPSELTKQAGSAKALAAGLKETGDLLVSSRELSGGPQEQLTAYLQRHGLITGPQDLAAFQATTAQLVATSAEAGG